MLKQFLCLDGWKCISGGAKGADEFFSNLFKNTMVISFNNHKVSGRYSHILIYEDTFLERFKPITAKIAKSIGRKLSRYYQYQCRDILQVKLSKEHKTNFVLAFAEIEKDFKTVSGGTAYAVKCAIMLEIPVYIISNNNYYYYSFKENKFILSSFITIRNCIQKHKQLNQLLFTGIGSRKTNKNFFKQTVIDLFKN